MKFYTLLHLFFYLVLLISCKDEKADSTKIQIDLNKSGKGKFSDIFSKIEYLLLDMGKNEVLVRPYHIDFTEERIIVEDRDLSNIHIFDRSGNLQSSIKSSYDGGPGTIKQSEYIQIKNDKILIYDIPMSKTVVYDLEGNFIEENKESLRFEAFYNFDNSRILFNGLNDLQQGKIFIKEKNNIQSDTSLIYYFPKDYHWIGIGTKDGFMEDQSSPDVYFNIPYSYELVQFEEGSNLKQTYEFDLGSNGISHDERFKMAENRELRSYLAENGLINDIHSFFPMKSHFFMYLYQHGANRKPTHHFLMLDRNMNVFYQCIDPKNDLDEMTIGGVPWTYHENKIYFIVNSNTFYNQYIQKFSGQNVEIKPGNVHHFFQKNQEKLKDDQTVMVSLELREDLNLSN